jgi:predicted nuclease of predicted toxin-antitoxin system
MRVLLDECLPEPLKLELPGHQVRTAHEAGLAGKKNGILLELASAQFDVLVTIDRSLPAQQHLAGQTLGVVVLRARSNSFAALKPLLPNLRKALTTIAPGQVVRLGPPGDRSSLPRRPGK